MVDISLIRAQEMLQPIEYPFFQEGLRKEETRILWVINLSASVE